MSISILNVSVTYKHVPIHELEQYMIRDVDTMYDRLREYYPESFVIQTCNRVEVYAIGNDESFMINTWAEMIGMDINKLSRCVSVSKDNDAIVHLFRLASGLDSLILGEDQILTQVKKAYEYAKGRNTIGLYLAMIVEKAIRTGARVRASTDIGKGSLSYGSVAVRLSEDILGSLDDISMMLIGSGEGASMIAKALVNRGLPFIVTSRTIERANAFSETIGGEPMQFEDAMNMLHKVDVLFIATTAPYYLITYERMLNIVNMRSKPLLIVDISNPSTVDPKVRGIEGIRFIGFDEVAGIVERNMHTRMSRVNEAEQIIEEEVKMLEHRLKRSQVEPMIDSLFRRIDVIRRRELEKALNMLDISEEQKRIVEQLSYAIAESILSIPMDELRRASEIGDSELIRVAGRLFRYEDRV